MKRAAIVLGITLILAGLWTGTALSCTCFAVYSDHPLYGMNFDYMPELHLRWAYPVFLVLLFSVAVGMIVYFKRRKWL